MDNDPAKNLERVMREIQPKVPDRPVSTEGPPRQPIVTHVPNPGPWSPASKASDVP